MFQCKNKLYQNFITKVADTLDLIYSANYIITYMKHKHYRYADELLSSKRFVLKVHFAYKISL